MNALSPEHFMADDALIEKDYDYMRRMVPESTLQLFELMEDICDRLEYEGSFLYDECPDKTTILNLTDNIHHQLTHDMQEEMATDSAAPITLKDFIQTMLCSEILYRRCRYHRKKKMFQ